MNPIKITIATVTYNAGSLLERTMGSVAEQDYPNVEHLIVDGNSQDNTLTVFHHYQELNSNAAVRHELVCRSEPDKGLYDAMNKAIGLATGDYICFLNAGDKLHSPHTLSHIAECAAGRPAILYGDTEIVDNEGHSLGLRRLRPPRRLSWKSFKKGMLVCHQSFYARTDLTRQTPYNLRYRFSADFDWCIRLMKEARRKHQPIVNTQEVLSDYLNEGLTTKNHKKSLFERYRIMGHHYGYITASVLHLWFILRSLLKR